MFSKLFTRLNLALAHNECVVFRVITIWHGFVLESALIYPWKEKARSRTTTLCGNLNFEVVSAIFVGEAVKVFVLVLAVCWNYLAGVFIIPSSFLFDKKIKRLQIIIKHRYLVLKHSVDALKVFVKASKVLMKCVYWVTIAIAESFSEIDALVNSLAENVLTNSLTFVEFDWILAIEPKCVIFYGICHPFNLDFNFIMARL